MISGTKRAVCGILFGFVLSAFAQTNSQPTFLGREIIPAFQLEGKQTKIHTQGLFVTENSYYVTGRLEGTPRRPLLLRIDRATRQKIEFLNLLEDARTDDVILDHPSGLDFEAEKKQFWMALSPSRPNSRSIIIRVPLVAEGALRTGRPETAFEVSDHIGSIAFDPNSKRIYGANWDTKIVYIWDTSGGLVRRLAGIEKPGDWFPAVQDWKCIGAGRILAGGLDKSPEHPAHTPRSVLGIWTIDPLKRLSFTPVPAPEGITGELANEGCALWKDQIYLLPGDLGPEASIFKFSFPFPAQHE